MQRVLAFRKFISRENRLNNIASEDFFLIVRNGRSEVYYSVNLFNLYAEYIMRNPGLEEAQAVIKIARKKYQ